MIVPEMIRQASLDDISDVVTIFRSVLLTDDAYDMPHDTTDKSIINFWFPSNGKTFVHIIDSSIAGCALIKPDKKEPDTANAAFIVSSLYRRRGIGSQLANYIIEFAKTKGYKALKFNFVISTNHAAISLWEKLGFQIVGRDEKAYNHKKHGLVDALVMRKSL